MWIDNILITILSSFVGVFLLMLTVLLLTERVRVKVVDVLYFFVVAMIEMVVLSQRILSENSRGGRQKLCLRTSFTRYNRYRRAIHLSSEKEIF